MTGDYRLLHPIAKTHWPMAILHDVGEPAPDVFWQAIQILKRHDGLTRAIALGLLAAFVGLTVHHLVDKLYVNNVYIHLGVMLGLLQLLDRQTADHDLQSVG